MRLALARVRYTILYRNRKERVSAKEQEQLWLHQQLAATPDPRVWRYIGQERTYHAMADLEELRPLIEQLKRQESRFLPGWFWWILGELKRKEMLGTVEAMEASVRDLMREMEA